MILIVLVQFLVVLKLLDLVVYKGNVGVFGEMLSKLFQNPRFYLAHYSSKLSDSNFWVN